MNLETAFERIARRTVSGPTVSAELGACKDTTYKGGPKGRSQIYFNGRNHLISRLVLERKIGRALGEGMCALHRCDRPKCINEAHLYEGNMKQNVKDRDERTGHPMNRIENRPKKLNAQAVTVIRFLSQHGVSDARLANAYCVSRAAIYAIRTGRVWKEIA